MYGTKMLNLTFSVNMRWVELSLIGEASYRKELHELIRQHYLYTGSKLAEQCLMTGINM